MPLTAPDRQSFTEALAPEPNVSLANFNIEPQHQPTLESSQNGFFEINPVASFPQLPEVVNSNSRILHSHITPPSPQNIKTLHVTSLMTSQLSPNQPQLLSGEIPPATKRVLSTPDRQPLTPANAWETNVPLVTPTAVSRQQPATKFLENSQVQIKSAPEINTALSNSVPEPQLESAPELSGIQQHVVNRVVSSPQLPKVAPLAKQSFFETSDAVRGSHLEQVRTVSTLNTPRGKLRDFSEELNGFEQIVPSETIGLADCLANTATGMIHPLTAKQEAQPLESFASSDVPNSRIQESRTTHEQLSPSQYAATIQRSLEKTIHWKDVAGQGSDSVAETTPQKLEHLIDLYLQEKFRNLATPPNIKVSIGHVEIRGTQPPKPERPKPRPMSSSVMSLDEYLRRRAQGGRR